MLGAILSRTAGRWQAPLAAAAQPPIQVTVAIPATVITSEALTWVTISISAQLVRPPCRSATTSAEKVEKVVRPPQNPVMMASRYAGSSAG